MTDESQLVGGRYRLREWLGTGAMGVVWKGDDERLHRTVALKRLHLQPQPGSPTADVRARAMREGRIAARLLHPNAIAVFDVIEDAGDPWLVMEYLPSTSLAQVIAERGRLEPAEVAAIGRQVAAALAAAHRSGIVHRDVKPANVLLAEDGTAKISDFGISRAAGDVTLTASGFVAGTPAYFAPEVARGNDADFRSDVFSLGSTLYHAVEGAPPFGAHDNAIALLHKVSQGDIEPPSHAGPLRPVLLKLLDPDPDARPDMAEAAAELARLSAPPTPRAEVSTPSAEPGKNAAAARKRSTLVAALALVIVLAAGAAGWWLLSREEQSHTGASGTAASREADEASPSSSAASATGPSSPVSPTGEATSGPPSSSESDKPAMDPARRLEVALRDYYALIPGDLRAGYARLTDRFKRTRTPSFADYEAFWSRMRSVRVSDVKASGRNAVTATITYFFVGGGSTTERHVYTLVERGGTLAIDSQAYA
ncbi:serine/threonine protein kinase [Saccharomonospora amisosensis]|uniref:non-specific serine/threonine protein kinase n=1 Tax=Saccharomonospora amisosensis TaxID=1128677 RepID=A0A7X5URJ3_9PSEU|nr:serine/threonine-protein kinase [Saccharomonospora amisosensis]NIJ12562.1 serine/threonine protein kinase [Saccharomonospora amisosensis]